MHVQGLYHAQMTGQLLFATYGDLEESALVHWTPATTYNDVCRDLGYTPAMRFTHETYLKSHGFAAWLDWQVTRDPKSGATSPLATLDKKGLPKKRRRS